MIQARFVCGLLAAATAVVSAYAQQQQPPFRSGVDLMSVDVVVLDKAGVPVTGLTPEDFSVSLGKKPRRVVAADFLGSIRPERSPALRSAPAPSSNRNAIAPRTLMFLIDPEQMPAGSGRVALKGLADYIDRLAPADRVGVLTLSENRVSPTTDRAPVRDTISKLVGTSARLRVREMTFGEAPGIASRNINSLLAYWGRIADQGFAATDRTCEPQKNFAQMTNVPQVCVQQAENAIERFRHETRRVLNRLSAIVEAVATMPDPKSIVVVSGGLYSDGPLHEDFVQFESLAERARVAVSALFIEPDASAAGGSNTETKRLDSQIGFGGLVDLASLSRGTAQRVIGDSSAAIARLDRELSGHYVVSFERDAADPIGQRLDLEVKTKRPDVTLITRKAITPGRAISAPAADKAGPDLKAGVAALLKTAAPVSQFPIDVDTFAMPASASGADARIILAVRFGQSAKSIAALGFQFAEAGGKVISDGYEAPPKQLQEIDAEHSGFVTALAAGAAGRYVVRVGTIDSNGQRGSVQHAFEVPAWAQGNIRLSDLMFGYIDHGEFAPSAGPAPDGTLAIRLIVRDNSTKFDNLKVRLTVSRASDGTGMDNVELPLQQTPDPLRRFADASIRIGAYAPGEYVVTTTVTAGGTEIGQRQRAFSR